MNNQNKIKVRFAPSPTGMMHIGNVRAALMNFIFAKQKNGELILRIEDTDQERNLDKAVAEILENLKWLDIKYVGPFFQSSFHQEHNKILNKLIDSNYVYRCFCTQEELEEKRKRQISIKIAPRYDKTCRNLSQNQIDQKLNFNTPFIWRFRVPEYGQISFFDLAKKELNFNLENFGDFPITRSDKSFTFIFANCVDDISMNISHVFRGEDHLSNTVMQILIYKALNSKIPVFWHLPIICNLEGKKLSKRDFGFSLNDLKNEGFLPEAIINYLAILGATFKNEIMSIDEIINEFNFDNISSASTIKYDENKLRWINQQWLQRSDFKEILPKIKLIFSEKYPNSISLSDSDWKNLWEITKNDIQTVNQTLDELGFIFEKPLVNIKKVNDKVIIESTDILEISIEQFNLIKNFINNKKVSEVLSLEIPKEIKKGTLYQMIRLLVTGKSKGHQIQVLSEIMPNYILYL